MPSKTARLSASPSPPPVDNPALARIARIRQASPPENSKLKAERIQEHLERFPGWQLHLAGPGLVRGFRFPTPVDATAFTVFAAGLLSGVKVLPRIEIVGALVSVHIATLAGAKEVSELDFEIAALLEGRED